MNPVEPHSAVEAPESPDCMLVFGDLHGRVLPAFRLATVWAREHHRRLGGILQVGDLGYFPDPTRLDKATIRHAKDDLLELGVLDVMASNPFADSVFADPDCPPGLWFTAGNHEDFQELEQLSGASGKESSFPVDGYGRVWCIKDGRVTEPLLECRVAAVWGVDGVSAYRRTNLPNRAYIRERAVDQLIAEQFHVLLCHDAPLDAKRTGYGSELLDSLIGLSQPNFVFFGHYHGDGQRIERDYGSTAVYHMAGFEMRERDGTPEPGSVGLLDWKSGTIEFEFLAQEWMKTFTRHNWKWR